MLIPTLNLFAVVEKVGWALNRVVRVLNHGRPLIRLRVFQLRLIVPKCVLVMWFPAIATAPKIAIAARTIPLVSATIGERHIHHLTTWSESLSRLVVISWHFLNDIRSRSWVLPSDDA